MFCVACMICAHGFAVECATALLLLSRKNKMQESIRTCVCNEGCFFDYGLYMFCVACMILAYVVAVRFALALLLISRSNKMQERVRTCVF